VERFTPFTSFTKWCSPACGVSVALANVAKIKAKELTKTRSANHKSKREFLEGDKRHVGKQARAYFHRWVKWRDRGLPCCACGKSMSGLPEWDKHASHYRPSKMNSAIRYHEDNINLGCSHCNRHRAGNESEYRVRLVEKIGIERVEWLDVQRHVKKWEIEELRDIRDDYKARLKSLDIKLPRVH
jgi:hypothetical protein